MTTKQSEKARLIGAIKRTHQVTPQKAKEQALLELTIKLHESFAIKYHLSTCSESPSPLPLLEGEFVSFWTFSLITPRFSLFVSMTCFLFQLLPIWIFLQTRPFSAFDPFPHHPPILSLTDAAETPPTFSFHSLERRITMSTS
jgi:hypothetical protein